MMKVSTGDRLNKLMTERGLKQVDILKLCDLHSKELNVKIKKSDLSQYVSGKVQPKQDKLSLLGMALGVSEVWLMGYDVPMARTSYDDIKKAVNSYLSSKTLEKLKEMNQEDINQVEEFIDFVHLKKNQKI